VACNKTQVSQTAAGSVAVITRRTAGTSWGFSLMQVSKVANSNCMEKEGLKWCLQNLERAGQTIDILATDR